MEISQLGGNTTTVCPNPDCDQLLTVKGDYAMDALDALFDQHVADNPACKKYQDSLPSLREVLESLHDHECVYGHCNCVCGCREATGCQLAFGSTLCTSCQIDNVRGGDCEPAESAAVMSGE